MESKLVRVHKKHATEQKMMDSKLNKERRKSAAAENNLCNEKEKRMEAKEALIVEKRKRAAAETKVSILLYDVLLNIIILY